MKFWDTSALVPLLLPEGDSAQRVAQLREDPVMAVWWATQIECESALERRLREKSLSAGQARAARVRLGELASHWHEVLPGASLRLLSIRLLRTHPLRAADALQLAAALTLAQAGVPGMAFLTADEELLASAENEGLACL
jgi:predicted nucleic acid-binding protein